MVLFDRGDGMQSFAAGAVEEALVGAGYEIDGDRAKIRVVFDIFEKGIGPQGFRIRREGDDTIRVVGGDSLGVMYGGLDVAEMITLGGGVEAIEEKAQKPYISRRGLKFNIPFDSRGPSYDDTGTSAQKNIGVMWEFDFWEQFLDTLAKNRYNVLTLWTCHPYPGIVKLPKYPDIGYDDVCVLKGGVDTGTDRHFNDMDMYDSSNFRTVKKMSLDDKVAFWTKVFDYAEDRGIDIYVFHWNI
ncbi:MAG: carbohydrate-binding family 6 protein, partial [Planctomycetes bacterium]|nr:carbohydrate-binding family 6 protein [Planctomycetota bacterium]